MVSLDLQLEFKGYLFIRFGKHIYVKNEILLFYLSFEVNIVETKYVI